MPRYCSRDYANKWSAGFGRELEQFRGDGMILGISGLSILCGVEKIEISGIWDAGFVCDSDSPRLAFA